MRLAAFLALLPLLLAAGCLRYQVTPHTDVVAGYPQVRVGEADLRVDVRGEGPPVLLVHGFGATLETWDLLVPSLARHHRCLRADLPGFGRSSKYAGDYGPGPAAEALVGFLDAEGVPRVHVVAHSYGAAVALTLAREHPERVDRIVLTDAFVYQDQLPWFFAWSRPRGLGEFLFGAFYDQQLEWRLGLSFHRPGMVNAVMVDRAREVLDLPGTRAAALAVVRGLHLEAAERTWAAVDRDVLLVWGREDEVTPLFHGERLARHLPRARLEVIPGAGHFPMLEAPAAYNALVRDFLGRGSR